MGSYHKQFVDKPKLGIYIWGTKTSKLGGFFMFNISFGTYNSIKLEILGIYMTFVVAVGDWHPKYKEHKEDVQAGT